MGSFKCMGGCGVYLSFNGGWCVECCEKLDAKHDVAGQMLRKLESQSTGFCKTCNKERGDVADGACPSCRACFGVEKNGEGTEAAGSPRIETPQTSTLDLYRSGFFEGAREHLRCNPVSVEVQAVLSAILRAGDERGRDFVRRPPSATATAAIASLLTKVGE